MKVKDMIQKTDKELAQIIDKSRADIAAAHIEMRTSQVANVKHIRNLKKTLARAMTITRQREIIAESKTETTK